MIQKLLIPSLVSIFIFSACGGGGSSDAPEQTEEETSTVTLKLTVGNANIASGSTLSRVTSNISEDTVNITTVSTNKTATITANGGADADLFVLKNTDKSTKKELSFISKRDANNPTDANQDGVYEVDIQATDEDGQMATYKAGYKIEVPKALELTIDNVVVDLTKKENIKTVNIDTKILATFSANNDATITLSDSVNENKFFKLIKNNDVYELMFKSKLDADSPTDNNRDGIYDAGLTIKSNKETIYYKISFKIEKPIAQTILRGTTYYWKTATNYREETMSHIRFRPQHNEVFITHDESDRKNEKVYNVDYIDTKAIVRAEDNSSILTCMVDTEKPNFLECQEKVNNETYTVHLSKDQSLAESIATFPESEYTLKAINIEKGIHSTVVEIEEFSLRGNSITSNKKAQLDYNEDKTNFHLNLKFKEETDAKVYIFFHTTDVEHTSSLGNHLAFNIPNKKEIKINGSMMDHASFVFETTVVIDDSNKFKTFPSEAYLNLIICDNNATSPSIDTCNRASIPVILK